MKIKVTLYSIFIILGFGLIIMGAGVLRFSKDEISAIIGTSMLVVGSILITVTRFISK